MARRSQCSSAGDNPLDPNYLPPHYREEYRIAIDALVEEDLHGYYKFLQTADVVDFLSTPEIQYIQSSIKVPLDSSHSEQQSLGPDGESSSNTYWPVHSDLDVPGLDLGWPQMHQFIGPTEVTTLVSPPEPDMPSIKEQARRLIQNSWQVIAVVMDMFTDVDIFADLLNAAARNVAVYILLDEQNAHHFINMVNNCRVNLESVQFLRVRTVTGVTYHCRSGKSFKGQMMDRFLLTDCRAVLSGNYSFMWSFEKLHRSMAHLFLGQLVATFDEEFRILFAHSQPLVMEDVPAPADDFSLLQQRRYTKETPLLYRDPRKFQSLDTCHPEDRVRHSYDEPTDVDWRLMPLKRQASLHGPSDTYSRFPSQQPYDQNPSRIPKMENTAFKRHSYAEGGRFSYPFMQQQGISEPENQGRLSHRGRQPYPEPRTEPEIDTSGYDKFWSQGYHSADQYSEPGLPQGIQPRDNFDPVLNYLSSTRNVELDQGSEKSLPNANLPFRSPQPSRRQSLEQPYACQSSPNPTDQKQFFQEPNTDRKDPTVKRGLRNWRITSFLTAYDNPGDEGLVPPQATEPLKEPLNPTQQTAPGMGVSLPKIPNIREFKVPAIPRASQLPSYKKITVQEEPKKLPDEPTAITAETASITSDSSSTAEVEKTEEAEQKEPKTTALGRDGSFRRNYNTAAPRSSRLRSSLIFSSLDQQASQDTQTAPGQQDDESDTNEAEENKQTFLSKVLGQRRSSRKPLGWSHYLKSSTFDSSGAESSKPGDGTSKEEDKEMSKEEHSKDPSKNCKETESLITTDAEKNESLPSMPQPKPSDSKTDQPVQLSKSFLTTPLNVDMNDPDKRLMFFKELAAKRKAAKLAEAEKSKDKVPMKPPTDLKISTTGKKQEDKPEEDSWKMADASSSGDSSGKSITADDANKTAECESVILPLDASDETKKHDSRDVKSYSSLSQSCKQEETSISTNTGKPEVKHKQTATCLQVSTETESPSSKPAEDAQLSKTAAKEESPSAPPKLPNAAPATIPSHLKETDKSESSIPKLTLKSSSSLSPSSLEVVPSSASDSENPQSVQLETNVSSSALPSEQHTGSELTHSNPAVESCSQMSPSSPTSNTAPLCTSGETLSCNVTPKSSSSRPAEEVQLVKTAAKENRSSQSPTPTNAAPATIPSPSQGTDESESPTLKPDLKASCSVSPSLEEVALHCASDTDNQLETSVSSAALLSEQQTESELTHSNPIVESCFSDDAQSDSGSQMSQDPPTSNSSEKTSSSDFSPKDSSSTLFSNIFSPKPDKTEANEFVNSSSCESSQAKVETSTTFPESKSLQDPVPQSVSSETISAAVSAHVEFDASPKLKMSSSQSSTKTNSEESHTPLETDAPKSEQSDTGLRVTAEESWAGLSKDDKADSRDPSSGIKSNLPDTSDLESSISRPEQIESITPPPESVLSKVHSPDHQNTSPNTSESTTNASSQAAVPSELNLAESVTPAPVEAQSSSPVTDSLGPVFCPEAEKTETNMSRLCSPSVTPPIPSHITLDSNKASAPAEPTSKTSPEQEPPPGSVISESQPSEAPIPAEKSKEDRQSEEPEQPISGEKKTEDTEATKKVKKSSTQGSGKSKNTNKLSRQNSCSEATENTSEEVVPLSPKSKQPKSSQSRYHSSTANVLSSSNLRDDTKLLLEQISANSQSRNEATKESPVTDEEKEDEAGKKAKRETERRFRTLSRVPKSQQERDKALERIQSMRKERKVYSRFEMAP